MCERASTEVDVKSQDLDLARLHESQRFRGRLLEMLVHNAPLEQILDALVCGVEQHMPQSLCSLVLLDAAGQRIAAVVAPHLPDFFNAALVGLPIGPTAGSCGTAAFTGQLVVVEDIASHPYWDDYRPLAQRAGLGACWSQPIVSASGQVLGTFAVYYRQRHKPDATDLELIGQSAALACIAIEKVADARRLRESEERYRTMVEWAPDPILVHRGGTILYVNPAAIRAFGATQASDLVGRQTHVLVHPDFRAQQTERMLRIMAHQPQVPKVESRFVRLDGSAFDVEVQGTAIVYDDAPAIHVSIRDITPLKEYQRQLESMAHFDVLTQLPNRVLLADRLQLALAQAQRRARSLAIAFIDLDGFKAVNDLHGHRLGDDVLRTVAQRMKTTLREGDTLARFGGDEFVAVLVDLEQASDCEPILERLLSVAADPVVLGGAHMQVSASAGLALYPRDGEDADQLLRLADQAMYRAKLAGRNRYVWFGSSTS